jgi:ribonuclease HI
MYKLFFDGCSKGNPGKAGAGAVLYLDCDAQQNVVEVWAESKYVGDYVSNNVAEYHGLLLGLERLIIDKVAEPATLTIVGDSLLVIKQMRGDYKVKSEALLPLYLKAKTLAAALNLKCITYQHVLRNENKRADELSNMGLFTDATFHNP